MGNINDKVKELDPHVLSIRFTNGITVVDCAFDEAWAMPKSDSVGYEKTPEKPNYRMLYPLNEKVGLEEMLDYVRYVMKVNKEREEKIRLLKIKMNELKTIFSKNSLEKCKKLEFKFSNEDVNLDDMPIYDEPVIDTTNDTTNATANEGEGVNEGVNDAINDAINPSRKIDGEVPVVQEISQKEILDNKYNINPSTAKFNKETFDLPPKTKEGKIILETFDEPEIVCKCDPNDPKQMCPICIDSKY